MVLSVLPSFSPLVVAAVVLAVLGQVVDEDSAWRYVWWGLALVLCVVHLVWQPI